MITAPQKITRKGQVTLPKKIREVLKSDLIAFEAEGESVSVIPIREVGGTLSRYALKGKSKPDFRNLKAQAWEEAVREKHKADPA
jgi:bifunctional DNA-binding transcriptional regulator/antitoxin component of YhaV-PrlF toxin-antitoxin module